VTVRAAVLALVVAACNAPQVKVGGEPNWSVVRDELARRVEVDQALRREATEAETITIELAERVGAVDSDNTAWMKDLVTRHGWPTRARVGEKGAGDAWLLVQHADHDVDFQEHCLDLIRSATEQGQADPRNLAYLTDRVALNRGRPQRYGTQFVQKEGGLEPYQLEDPAMVEKWRAEVGLDPLAEYAERLRKKQY
jgi:hypothetical protein